MRNYLPSESETDEYENTAMMKSTLGKIIFWDEAE